MKLSSVEISEFQSIRHSNRFDIGDITCLVGKNESGKTAILHALYRLNPLIPQHGNFDVTDDYPRAEVEDYQQDIEASRREPATVVKATFTLSAEELASIESEFGTGVLKKPEITLSKGYNNERYIDLLTDETIAVKAIIEAAQLPTDLAQELSASPNLETLRILADTKTDPEIGDHINRLKSYLNKLQENKGLPLYIYNNTSYAAFRF